MLKFIERCNDFLEQVNVLGNDIIVTYCNKPLKMNTAQVQTLVSNDKESTLLCYSYGNSKQWLLDKFTKKQRLDNFQFGYVPLLDNPYNVELVIKDITNNNVYIGIVKFLVFNFWFKDKTIDKYIYGNKTHEGNEINAIQMGETFYWIDIYGLESGNNLPKNIGGKDD